MPIGVLLDLVWNVAEDRKVSKVKGEALSGKNIHLGCLLVEDHRADYLFCFGVHVNISANLLRSLIINEVRVIIFVA